MRALSPILSAVILLMATLAAGAIMYQYFIDTVEIITDKPILYAYNAEYLSDLGVVYVTLDNSGSQKVDIVKAQIDCINTTQNIMLSNKTIDAGETKTIRIQINTTECKVPRILVIGYNVGDKSFTTEPIRIS